MPDAIEPRFRAAGRSDADAIARLHVDSWRRHYRGAYSDAFLDGDVTGFLLGLWTERLAVPDGRSRTMVAESDDVIVGIAHIVFGKDAGWGSRLGHLHLTSGVKP